MECTDTVHSRQVLGLDGAQQSMWTSTTGRVYSALLMFPLFQGKGIAPAEFDVYEPRSRPSFHPIIVLAFEALIVSYRATRLTML